MEPLQPTEAHHIWGVGISPNEGDIAIASIDNIGTSGSLNLFVLREYGYSEKDLPDQEQLMHNGFALVASEDKKPILFVVTVNGRNTRDNLEKNLYNALAESIGWIEGRKVWVPLLGTGSGGLSLEESYLITMAVIDRFQRNLAISLSAILSIPDNPAGKQLLSQLNTTGAKENANVRKAIIAGLISDSETGDDYLEIMQDVNAFARVIAAKSFEPPLAIALFGKWGSGKSFFMGKLKEQIIDLSETKTQGIYCKGIVHIHFNAWSYVDSNLWASIVTKIFEELNEYISENSKSNDEKQAIEKQLTEQLSIAKEEIGLLQNKKNAVVGQIQSLKQKRKHIAEKLDDKINKVKTATVWKVIDNANKEFNAKTKILNALKANDSYLKSEDELKRIIPEKYWSNPEKTYQLAKSRHTFLKEFFRRDKIWTNVLWLGGILLLIFFSPVLLQLLSIQISKTDFLIPQALLSLLITGGTVWRRAETVYHDLQPLVASFWNVKENHEKKIKEAISTFRQEEKALTLEIEKGKSEVLLIEEQIQKAETIKADLEYRINHAFATEALYSFIDRRSKSEDYKKHLGIISIIRKDFEILNSLFSDHNQETEKIRNAANEFKSKFKKPLERIVLYIDDLDRCPEENVVQVLEAVNLLMAFPLFVVVVGVDERWVKNALLKKHAIQFTGKLDGYADNGTGLELIEPSNYLEKIFQIPFHLNDAKDASVKKMIGELARSKAQSKATIEADNNAPKESTSIGKGAASGESTANHASTLNQSNNNQDEHRLIDKAETLVITDDEIALMQDMSEIIGNNPRAIKRFVNIYRIVKAHEEFVYDTETTNQELISVLFLLALPLGDYRKLLPSFESFIQDESNSSKLITEYMLPTYPVNSLLDDLKQQLDMRLSNKQSLYVLQNTTAEVFNKHSSFIRRFTFKQL